MTDMNHLKPIDKALRLESERLLLKPITEEDTEAVLSIRNSDYVRGNFFYRKEITSAEHLNYVRNKCETGEVFYFTVTDKTTGAIIGVVYLQHFEPEEKAMESGLFFDKASPKGKGYATEAYRLLDKYAFEVLKLEKLVARVICYNGASVHLHEKMGYETVERSVEKIFPTGEEVEAVTLELVKENFREKN